MEDIRRLFDVAEPALEQPQQPAIEQPPLDQPPQQPPQQAQERQRWAAEDDDDEVDLLRGLNDALDIAENQWRGAAQSLEDTFNNELRIFKQARREYADQINIKSTVVDEFMEFLETQEPIVARGHRRAVANKWRNFVNP